MKYSIIVPIYNVMSYLPSFFSCLRGQIEQHVEVILVDDGSTDGSSSIAEAFALESDRVQYLKKENGGLSDARNYGLKAASGEYIIFCDSDDLIDKRLISSLDQAIGTEGCDVILINFIKITTDDEFYSLMECHEQISHRPISKRQLAQKPNFAWARVAKRELYKDNLFPLNVIYEDVVTTPQITQNASRIIEIVEPLYGYRKRPGSITTSSASKQFDLFEALHILEETHLNGLLERRYYITAFVNLIQSCLVSLARIQDKSMQYEKAQQILKEYRKISYRDVCGSLSLLHYKVLSLCARNYLSLMMVKAVVQLALFVTERKK